MKVFRRKRRMQYRKYRNRSGVIYWHGTPGQNQIALTFDDGPDDPHTLKILDILNEHKVKATFFMTGRNVKNLPEIARRVAEEGHAIGNHTYNHRMQTLATPSMAIAEIKQAEDVIREVTSISPKFFRPPYGNTNRWALHQVEKLGYIVCLWSINAGDNRLRNNWRRIEKKVLSESEDGAIILMHDGKRFSTQSSQSPTVLALPGIISSLKESGYQLVTTTKLLEL